MQYQEAVAEARTLVKRSEEDQWRLNQLTWEQVQEGRSARQWAADIGISERQAQVRVRIWEKYRSAGPADRPRHTDAFEEFINPRRFAEAQEMGLGHDQARAVMAVQDLPPEQKAEVVREALDDQDVAVRVLRDPHTRRNVTDAREQVANEIETAAQDRTDADPNARAIRDAARSLNVEAAISKARFWLAEATRLLQDMDDRPDDLTERLGADVDEVDLALGWLRTAIEGGQVSDDELARLLEGGA